MFSEVRGGNFPPRLQPWSGLLISIFSFVCVLGGFLWCSDPWNWNSSTKLLCLRIPFSSWNVTVTFLTVYSVDRLGGFQWMGSPRGLAWGWSGRGIGVTRGLGWTCICPRVQISWRDCSRACGLCDKRKGRVLVTQSCLTLCDPLDWGPPGFSVRGILQARTLEWVAIPFSRGSSWPRDGTGVSRIAGTFFTVWARFH